MMQFYFKKYAFTGFDGMNFSIKIVMAKTYVRVKIYEISYSEIGKNLHTTKFHYNNGIEFHKKIKNK